MVWEGVLGKERSLESTEILLEESLVGPKEIFGMGAAGLLACLLLFLFLEWSLALELPGVGSGEPGVVWMGAA